ncbi:MAG: hypothetical protein ACN4GW_02495 [Desulforhopalus sp.]
MADKTSSKKQKSIILPLIGGLLLVVLLGLFALPQLLSTDWAAEKVKQTVNEKAPGKVNFEQLSLGWFSPVRIQGISYNDPATGILVKIADVTTSKGLLALATNYKELGEINITEPILTITIKEKPAQGNLSTPTEQVAKEAPAPETDKPIASEPEQTGTVLFPIASGQFNITGGKIIAQLPEGEKREVLKQLELNLNVAGPANKLEYLIDFQAGDGNGKVHGQGNVGLAVNDLTNLDKTVSEAALDISNWQISELLSILAASGNLPKGSGLINGQMSVSGSVDTGLALKGTLTAEKIKLSGGPLTTDTPFMDTVDVELDALKTGSTLTVNRLALTSPMATGTASGTFGPGTEKQMASKMIIELAPLFTQFPATLKLKEGLTISSGQLNLDATVGGTETSTSFDTNARLDGLGGMAGKKKISLDKPITLQARGEQNSKGLRLDNFDIQSSFANGKGQGNMDQMQLTLAADLGAALKEIEKFIEVEGWKSTGKMDLELQVNTKTKSQRAILANVAIKDFILQQNGRVIAPRNEFRAALNTDLSLDDELQPQEMTDMSVDIESWLGKTALRVEKLVPPSDKKSVRLDNLAVKGIFKLDQLTTLLQSLEKLPGDTTFAGSMNIDSQLSLSDDKLQFNEMEINVKDLQLQKASQKLREKNIRITTRGMADLKTRALAFKPLEIITSAGDMRFPELAITDWNRIANSVRTSGVAKLDLDPLTRQLGDFIQLPPKTSVAGQAEIDLNIDLAAVKEKIIQLKANATNLKVTSENKPLVTEDSLSLIMDLKGDLEAQDFTLGKLELLTAPVSLNATGKVIPKGDERELTSEGSMTMNLQTVGSYLKSLADIDIEMTGEDSSPFSIAATSTKGEWVDLPRNTTFSSSFHAESIRGFGMLIESLELPIKLADSLGNIEIEGAVNKGTMSLKPTIDFSSEPPVVSIPENSSLLTKVGLTEDMSKDLLVHIHPIFKGAAVSRGTVDLTMQNFRWPLDEAARKDAAFTGHLTFNQVKLQAGGLIAPILDLMKVEDREITLSEQPMEFVGKNERVTCSPLEMSVNEYILKLSGSIGFDQSLDYVAQIPVTRKMVSGDVYKYLEGTFISVPIGGTVSKPAISKNLVQKAIKDLAIQAGSKQISDQAGKLLQKLFQ